MYLLLVLLADVLDHQEAVFGERTDGFSMTIYGAIFSGCTGIATGLMNGVLAAVGYSSSNIFSEAIRAAMPWIFIGGETIGYAAIFAMFLFMSVEKYGSVDRYAIAQQNGTELPDKPDDKLLSEFNTLRKKAGKREIR